MSGKKTKKRKGIRIFHVLLIVLVVYVGFVMNHQRKLMNNLQDRRASVEMQISGLERVWPCGYHNERLPGQGFLCCGKAPEALPWARENENGVYPYDCRSV